MRQVPQLPGLVIAGSGQDGLAGVQRYVGHRQQMALQEEPCKVRQYVAADVACSAQQWVFAVCRMCVLPVWHVIR
jgi:hypothetical protein